MYLERELEEVLNNIKDKTTSITIYGFRQVGKSTLIDHVFQNKIRSINLDDVALRKKAQENPKDFLADYGTPLIIDEIQKVTELLDEIKIIIDNHKLECLKNDKKPELLYILTGSSQYKLRKAVSESLAGRTIILNLPSLSFNEISKRNHSLFNPDIKVLKEKENLINLKRRSRKEIFEDIFKGGMPEYKLDMQEREFFFSTLLTTFIERDIKDELKIKNETKFLALMEYLALRTGCQIDYSDISRAIGIDVRTVSTWISLLITSNIIVLLEPYMKNLSDRIIKSPKLYFLDTGLCSYLCKWPNASMLENCAMNGQFYETYVVSEIIKSYYNHGIDYRRYLYYYRDKNQAEVDLIIDTAEGIYPLEIKKGINPSGASKNFNVLNKFNKKVFTGLVISSVEHTMKINEYAYYCPIDLIGL